MDPDRSAVATRQRLHEGRAAAEDSDISDVMTRLDAISTHLDHIEELVNFIIANVVQR